MTCITDRTCILHTLDGEFKAHTATEPMTDFANREVIRISSDESAHAIYVMTSMVAFRFEGNDCPTFYAC